MLVTLADARAQLEAQGLHVSANSPQSLWIASTVRDAGAGIGLSTDACALLGRADRWFAVFPAKGSLTFEFPGTLSELVTLIIAIHAHCRESGEPFQGAFKHFVADAEQYLIGRSLTPAV